MSIMSFSLGNSPSKAWTQTDIDVLQMLQLKETENRAGPMIGTKTYNYLTCIWHLHLNKSQYFLSL